MSKLLGNDHWHNAIYLFFKCILLVVIYSQEIIVKQLFHLVYLMIPITLFQMALHILYTLVLSSTRKIHASFVKRLPDISSSYRSRWTCYKDDCHVPLLWLQNYVLMQCNVSSWERGGSYALAYNNPCD